MRLSRIPVAMLILLILAGCGSPAPHAVEAPPTLVLPTRVPVELAAGEKHVDAPTKVAAVEPTKIPPTTAPTRVAIQPTPTVTLIPTKGPPTATPNVTPTLNAASVRGLELFQNGTGEEGVPTCASCHHIDKDEAFTGPSLIGVARKAARRVPGQVVDVYLRNSIINPNAFIVPNEKDPMGVDHIYSAGGQSLMYQQFTQKLTPQQIDDLVAYLTTLR